MSGTWLPATRKRRNPFAKSEASGGRRSGPRRSERKAWVGVEMCLEESAGEKGPSGWAREAGIGVLLFEIRGGVVVEEEG